MADKPTYDHKEHERVINTPNYSLEEMHIHQLATIEAQAGAIALLEKWLQELQGIEVVKH